MGLFVKSEIIKVEDTEIEVKEIGVDYLLLSDTQKANTKEVLAMHTSLSSDEINNLTMKSFEIILEKFYELNSEHFEVKGTNTKEDKGK